MTRKKKGRKIAAPAETGTPLTVAQLKEIMPARQKQNITQSLVDTLNGMMEPENREAFRDNIIGFADVLADPNTTFEAYVNAVKYNSFLLMGYTNEAAWCATFPDRFQRLADDGKLDENGGGSYLRSLVCAYNRGKLVNRIREQAMIPTWIVNADVHQKAINRLAHLMTHAKSEKVQSDSAASLLTHLKQPEAAKVQLDVNVNHGEEVKELKDAVRDLAEQQRQRIAKGHASAREVAEENIIDGEFEEVPSARLSEPANG